MSAPQPTEFQRYPMWMRHPHEQPAVVSDDYAGGERRAHNAQPGRPLRFAPVLVTDKDGEEYHAAQGYAPTKGDPTAYLKAVIAPEPKGYEHREYPLIQQDGSVDFGPDAPEAPDNFYPYWVRMEGYEPTLVQDKETHHALLRQRGVDPNEPKPAEPEPEPAIDPQELLAFRAWQAAQKQEAQISEPETVTKPKRRGRPPKTSK